VQREIAVDPDAEEPKDAQDQQVRPYLSYPLYRLTRVSSRVTTTANKDPTKDVVLKGIPYIKFDLF
jgi:hypothetical protein